MNLQYLLKINPVLLAFYAALFTWGITLLGSAIVIL